MFTFKDFFFYTNLLSKKLENSQERTTSRNVSDVKFQRLSDERF